MQDNACEDEGADRLAGGQSVGGRVQRRGKGARRRWVPPNPPQVRADFSNWLSIHKQDNCVVDKPSVFAPVAKPAYVAPPPNLGLTPACMHAHSNTLFASQKEPTSKEYT